MTKFLACLSCPSLPHGVHPDVACSIPLVKYRGLLLGFIIPGQFARSANTFALRDEWKGQGGTSRIVVPTGLEERLPLFGRP